VSRKPVVLASTLVLLALLAFATVATQAQDGPYEILLRDPGEHEVPAGRTITLHGRWGGCRSGLVRAYIKGSHTLVTLDGEPLLSPEQIEQLWGPIIVHGTDDACMIGDTIYISHWYYELTLPPRGEPYVIHTEFFLDHPLVDGGDWDGDGKMDLFLAGLLNATDNQVLVYEE
jgi:hypothetical protein